MLKRKLGSETLVRHWVEQRGEEVDGSIWHGAELPDLVHNGVDDWAAGLFGRLDSLELQRDKAEC